VKQRASFTFRPLDQSKPLAAAENDTGHKPAQITRAALRWFFEAHKSPAALSLAVMKHRATGGK
jgi:hypothetical protein